MKIPALLKFEEVELPPIEPGRTRLVVAAGGVYRERHTSMFTSSTRVEPQNLGLAEHTEYCRLACGKLNRVMLRAMLSFFRGAHELHGGEAALVLLYDPDARRFRWHCPTQIVPIYWSLGRWVTSEYITFRNPSALPEGYVHFGDAHLHVGKVSTPSAIDVDDDQDGLHIVVADVHNVPRYHIDFVIDGKRFGVAPEQIFDDPHCPPFPRPPSRWLEQVLIQPCESGSPQVPNQSQTTTHDPAHGQADPQARPEPGNGESQA